MSAERKDCWDIISLVRVTHRVVFEEPVTKEEASELFLNDKQEDVIDERDQKIIEVERVV